MLFAKLSIGCLVLDLRECPWTIVTNEVLAGKGSEARVLVEDLRELFGGDFYLELQRTGRPQEEEYIHAAVKMAVETDCPVVATNDVRFIRPEDFEAHEARVCIQQGRVLGDTSRPRDYTEQQYLRTPEEMAELFADLPEALENTVEVAKCNDAVASLPGSLGKISVLSLTLLTHSHVELSSTRSSRL